MKVFPINMIVAGAKCVVVGGGEVAVRKALGLLEAGASVTLICREICPSAEKLAADGVIEIIRREYRRGDLAGAKLAIVATDDAQANREAASEARATGVPVNVADDPDLCDFYLPSVVRRGDVTIAVGSGGSSPALAARMAKTIDGAFGPEYGRLAEIIDGIRSEMKRRGIGPSSRKSDFDALIESGALEAIRSGDEERVSKLVSEIFGDIKPELKK